MPPSAPPRPPLVVAHRGASADAPEHTRAAYEAAVAAGADAVEVDVRLSRDGVLVCVHDDDLLRVAGVPARVDELTLEELRTLDVGSWFNRAHPERARPTFVGAGIVTLDEQVGRLDDDVGLVIELKDPGATGGRMEAALLDVLDRHRLLAAPRERLLVETFEADALERLRGRAPDLALGLLWYDEVEAGLTDAPPQWMDVSGPNLFSLFTVHGHVTRMHAAGRAVYAWTADDEEEVSALLDLGVDAVVTNRPGAVRAQLRG